MAVTPMNTFHLSEQHRLDSPKFGAFLFFPQTPDADSVNIQFYPLDKSPHDVVIEFPPTSLCAGRVLLFTRSATGNSATFETQTAREIWQQLTSDGWLVHRSRA
jgi:hypothetical protein